MACRSIGGLERVPLSVLLRRTGSSVSNNGRVSDDATPTPSGPSQGTTSLFTARWPTVHRWGLTCLTYYVTYCFNYGVSAHVQFALMFMTMIVLAFVRSHLHPAGQVRSDLDVLLYLLSLLGTEQRIRIRFCNNFVKKSLQVSGRVAATAHHRMSFQKMGPICNIGHILPAC